MKRALAVLCLMIVGSSALAQSKPRSRTYEVFDAVLDSLYHSHGDRPEVVIVADSLSWRDGGVAYAGKFLLPHRSVIRSSTVESFERATDKSVPFMADYRYKQLLHVLTEGEFRQLMDRGKAIGRSSGSSQLREMPYWIAFTEKFPKAWGLTVLSRPGFNADSTESLIYVRHQCGGGCYSSEVILLDRLPAGWRIVERINAQSNEGLGSGAMRYLGPGAHFVAMIRREQDSVRRAIADSIARDRAPRRIRGTIINRQTGLPIAHAQIFVRTSAFPGESVRRVVADARGRYVIMNPKLGGTMLEVQCPGPAHRVGWTLDAPGTYVFPAMDTVIDMGPPNIAPCWRSPRVHSVSSGQLSSMYLQSPFPSASEMGVYAALIRDLALADSSILFADTRGWCGIFHQCPRIHVAHLERSGFLDPSTMANFRRVSSDSVPLNPSVIESTGVALLASGERDYLIQESARANIFGWQDAARDFWSLLRESHPGVTRIISFTRPGFSSRQDQAIVGFRVLANEDEETETVLLKKTGDSWSVARRNLESEPISGALVDGSCIPIEPDGGPSREEIFSVRGVYDFTLVSSATDGRSTAKSIDVSNKEISLDARNNSANFSASNISFRIRRVSRGFLFGEWAERGYGDAIPIDKDGNAIPLPAGHFCAKQKGD
jgi:hypothetical protein